MRFLLRCKEMHNFLRSQRHYLDTVGMEGSYPKLVRMLRQPKIVQMQVTQYLNI